MKYIPGYNHFTQKNCTNIIYLCRNKLFSIKQIEKQGKEGRKRRIQTKKKSSGKPPQQYCHHYQCGKHIHYTKFLYFKNINA